MVVRFRQNYGLGHIFEATRMIMRIMFCVWCDDYGQDEAIWVVLALVQPVLVKIIIKRTLELVTNKTKDLGGTAGSVRMTQKLFPFSMLEMKV